VCHITVGANIVKGIDRDRHVWCSRSGDAPAIDAIGVA
jgi:hypothetical protein